jgi:hypothetical protein
LGNFLTRSGEDERRRKMVAFAMFAPARVVFSPATAISPPPCAPPTGIEDEQATADPVAPVAHGGRHSYVVVHHTGGKNAHLDTTSDYCSSGYDFFIRADGEIVVCGRRDDPVGRHAQGCNCAATGVMLNGCFGGCEEGNVERPTERQECSLAHVLRQLGTPDEDGRIVPHRYCAHWNPCGNPAPTRTFCCGTNLTTDDTRLRWNAEGDAFVARVRQKRRNLEHLGCCTPPCPQAVGIDGEVEAFIEESMILDAWDDRGLRISLRTSATSSGATGCVADAHNAEGVLVARRWFLPSAAGIVAGGELSSDFLFGLVSDRRRRRRRQGLLLAGAVTVATAIGVLALTGDEATSPPGEPVRHPPVRCDPPGFGPRRLPWSAEVGPPTERSSRDDGSSELTWAGPPPPGRNAPQEVSIIRRVQPMHMEVTSATATARGNPAQITLVGDEGVGAIRVFWQEGADPCESYELNVSHGATIDDTIALLPPP